MNDLITYSKIFSILRSYRYISINDLLVQQRLVHLQEFQVPVLPRPLCTFFLRDIRQIHSLEPPSQQLEHQSRLVVAKSRSKM